ncbi:lipocalin family protein [uncultured Bacteroides sp.]|uniref:lipocalin family protein n=1 Tax=uncultured Bacteroides sp. TaxID=162156 RepID=UPI002621FD46|nr:lipocalin family protein [uncultured Bacteroides sp.]
MNKSLLVKGIVGLMAATAFVSCHQKEQAIEGTWVEVAPDSVIAVQGVVLEQGGKAASVNPAALQYESWQKEGNLLILTGGAMANGQAISVVDTFTILKVTDTEMILQNDEMTITYEKQQ